MTEDAAAAASSFENRKKTNLAAQEKEQQLYCAGAESEHRERGPPHRFYASHGQYKDTDRRWQRGLPAL